MPPRLVWLLPFALVLQFAVQVGLGWILAATYVFFRDLTPILGFVLSVVFYLSPILYPVAGRFERFFVWNPMTPLLGLFRSAMLSARVTCGRFDRISAGRRTRSVRRRTAVLPPRASRRWPT